MSRSQPFTGSVSGGTVFLIGGALEQIGGGRLGDEGFTERFTDTLMTKMSQWSGGVEPSDLPMVRQTVGIVLEARAPVV
ncbi:MULTISPECIES: hypothetical protein [unclassified Streptomyces]|uniref:hypothetical protein n=1 Tax=unclassified Streptomyces TaxID=2593676 RepID=UPI0035D71AEF